MTSEAPNSLSGQTALVTGASRGIGRGIAIQLAQAGATVYITGRPPKQSDSQNSQVKGLPTLEKTAQEINESGASGKAIAIYCDHSKDEEVEKLFDQISKETGGKLDILTLTSNFDAKFWELEPSAWDDCNHVGLRNHYICSVYAARMMVKHQHGLIVTVSSAGGLNYLFSTAYGVGKAACDRLACDMAHELRSQHVCSISLWPGAVKTELFEERVMKADDKNESKTLTKMKSYFERAESTQFSGKCIAAIAADPKMMRWTERILPTADVADAYGFVDIDGERPESPRSFGFLATHFGYTKAARYQPKWLKLPGWLMVAFQSHL